MKSRPEPSPAVSPLFRRQVQRSLQRAACLQLVPWLHAQGAELMEYWDYAAEME